MPEYLCLNSNCILSKTKTSEKHYLAEKGHCRKCGEILVGLTGTVDLEHAAKVLPTMLATIVQEYLDETHNDSPHKSVILTLFCHLAETAYRFLAFILVSEHYERLNAETRRQIALLLEQPTFGNWIEIVRLLPCQSAMFPEIESTLIHLGKFTSVTEHSIHTNLVELRNLISHNPITGGRMNSLWRKWLPSGMDEIVKSLMWLEDVQLLASGGGSRTLLLRGSDPKGIPLGVFQNWSVPETNHGMEIWIARGNWSPMRLFPFIRFASPEQIDGDLDISCAEVQMYNRRDNVNLYYSVFGDGLIGSAPTSNLIDYCDILKSQKKQRRTEAANASVGQIPYLDVLRQMEQWARSTRCTLVGRESEVARLRDATRRENGDTVIYWLDGPPGMGKSFITASYAVEMLDNPEDGELVVYYRFHGGDIYCDEEKFQEAIKCRLDDGFDSLERPWANIRPKAGDETENRNAFLRLSGRLDSIPEGKSLLLILDGLDELCSDDSKFIYNVVLKLPRRGVRVVCSTRKMEWLTALLSAASGTQAGCVNRRVFADGLGPMRADEIRNLILRRLVGKPHMDVIRCDTENGNEFIETLVARSRGYPAYINFAIQDFFRHKLTTTNFRDYLPPGLEHYQEQLLDKLHIDSDEQAHRAEINALIAVAKEPISAEQIALILSRSGRWVFMTPETVLNSIRNIGMILSEKRSADNVGYEPYSHGLREQIVTNVKRRELVFSARSTLSRLPEYAADAILPYSLRHGVAHILDMVREYGTLPVIDATALLRRAMCILTDFSYIMTRLRTLGGSHSDVIDLLNDFDGVAQAFAHAGMALSHDELIWIRFMRFNAHMLQRATAEWPAHKILLQLAIEHTTGSPITKAAREWLAADDCPCDWAWLRNRVMPRGDGMSPCEAVLDGHSARVEGALLFLNETRVLSWSQDGSLIIWNLDGEVVKRLEHGEGVIGVLPLPDGKAFSWGRIRPFIVWELASGKMIREIECPKNASLQTILLTERNVIVFWSNDRPRYLIHLWNHVTDEIQILHGHRAEILGILPMPDGERLLSWAGDGELLLWNLNVPGEFLPIGRFENGSPVAGAAAAPDGSCVVAWSKDGQLRRWNANGNEGAVMHGHEDVVLGIAFIPEHGAVVSWSRDRTIRVWNLDDGKQRAPALGYRHDIQGVLVAEGGETIVSWGDHDGSALLWRPFAAPNAEPDPERLSGHRKWIRAAKLFPDGKRLLTIAEDKNLRVWDLASRRCLHVMEGHMGRVIGAKIYVDERRILSWSADLSLRIWDLRYASDAEMTDVHEGTLRDVFALPDGKRLLSVAYDATPRIWNRESGVCEQFLFGHTEWVFGARLFSDGRRLLTWSRDKTLRIWDLATSKSRPLTGHEQLVWGASLIAGEARVLSWSADATARIWDVSTNTCLTLPHEDFVHGALGLAADAEVLTWSEDTRVRLWSAADGALLHTFVGHSGPVTGACVYSGGKYAFSWSRDGGVIRWDLKTRKEAGRLKVSDSPVANVVPLRDGSTIIVWHEDGAMYMGNMVKGCRLQMLYNNEPYINLYFGFRRNAVPTAFFYNRSSIDRPDAYYRVVTGYGSWQLASPESVVPTVVAAATGAGDIIALRLADNGHPQRREFSLGKDTVSLLSRSANGEAFEFFQSGCRRVTPSGPIALGSGEAETWAAFSRHLFDDKNSRVSTAGLQWHCPGSNVLAFNLFFAADDCLVTGNHARLRILAYMNGRDEVTVSEIVEAIS